MSKIEIKNVYKIFGENPAKILPMVKEGATKEEVLEKTGHSVGLDNVSIKSLNHITILSIELFMHWFKASGSKSNDL